MKKSLPPFPRLSGRLYLFPAFLPMVEIIPWVLAALGGMAGMASAFHRHRRRLKILFLVLCLVAFGGAVGYVISYKHAFINAKPDGGLVAQNELATPIVHTPVAVPVAAKADRFARSWEVALQDKALSSPVADHENIYFGTHNGLVQAFAQADGHAVWSLPKDKKPIYALMLSKDGVLYVGEGLHQDNDVSMSAVVATTGQPLWARRFVGHLEEPASIDYKTDHIFFGAGPGGLWALERNSGDVVWHAPMGHCDTQPLIMENHIIAPAQVEEGSDKSFLFFLDAMSGVEETRVSLQGQPWGAPYYDAARDVIFTTSGRGQIGVPRETDAGWLYAISPTDHSIVWQRDLPTMAIGPEIYIAEHGLIITTLKNGQIIAYSMKDGAQVWRTQVGIEMQSTSALVRSGARPLLAVTSYEGIFSVLDAISGSTVFTNALELRGTSAPVAAGDHVFVLTQDRLLSFSGLSALAPE